MQPLSRRGLVLGIAALGSTVAAEQAPLRPRTGAPSAAHSATRG